MLNAVAQFDVNMTLSIASVNKYLAAHESFLAHCLDKLCNL